MKKVFAGIMTAVTAAALYEVSLIGTKARTEDIAFVNACTKAIGSGKGKKVKKILKRR